MNNSYITIIKEKRTVLSRKRIPLNQNECTADFRIGVPFERNLHPSVLHLMRGQVFELCGKTFFTFGGASSHDVSGGILDRSDPSYQEKKRKLDRGWKPYRINHLSWWKEELASEEEMEEGRNNLAAHDNRVDFIVTHCCASSVQDAIGEGLFQKDRETEYLEEILQTVQFQKWFFGHYHDNRNVDEKKILLYEQIIRVV